jgi:hypothetical protein
MGAQGAATLQKYREEHPEWTRQNAVRALAKAREVKLAGLARAREQRAQEQARLHLLSKFPRNAAVAEQIKWLGGACLKIARSPVEPPKWMLPALAGMLACVRALPADSGEAQRNADAAQIAFLRRELKHSDALWQEAVQRAQKAEQRVRDLEAEPVAVTPVAIEQSPKVPATGPAAGAASPLEFYIRADADGAVYLGRDYDSCCRAPARRVTQSPQPMAIL